MGRCSHRWNLHGVHNIQRGSRRLGSRFRPLHLHLANPDYPEAEDVKKKAVVGPRCLWDCFLVSSPKRI